MRQIKNIKYTFYDKEMNGPYQGTFIAYCPQQTSYTSIEDMLQKTHPDYRCIRVISYDVED